MSTNNKITSGALYSLLNDDSIHKQTVLEIEAALAIDSNFQNAKDLVLELLSLISILRPCKKQKQWLKALTEINRTDDSECDYIPSKAAVSRRSAEKKLAEYIKKYPLPAFFLKNLRPSLYNQSKFIRTLWLAALFKKAPVQELSKSAESLRAALNNQVDPEKEYTFTDLEVFHSQIPDKDPNKFYEHLNTLKNNLDSTPNEKDSEAIAALRWLAGLVHEENDKLLTPPLPSEASTEPKKTKYTGTRQRTIEAPFETGRLTVHKINLSRSIDNEPPEFINLFALNPEDLNNGNGKENSEEVLVSESEIEQQVQESSYWLIRHEKIVPIDYGRFTLAERIRVAQFISNGIVSSDPNKKLAAGLIGTMYVTGLSLVDLLNANFGHDQIFDQRGVYRREIRPAQDAFIPNEMQLNHMCPFTNELSLKLPDPVASWINSFYMFPGTLGNSLGLELEDAKQHVHAELETLRAKGCYQRIRAERIPSALAIETTLMFRDPLITFLLAAKPTQGAPKLSYYATHSAEKLSQYYEQVTQKMVNPCII